MHKKSFNFLRCLGFQLILPLVAYGEIGPPCPCSASELEQETTEDAISLVSNDETRGVVAPSHCGDLSLSFVSVTTYLGDSMLSRSELELLEYENGYYANVLAYEDELKLKFVLLYGRDQPDRCSCVFTRVSDGTPLK